VKFRVHATLFSSECSVFIAATQNLTIIVRNIKFYLSCYNEYKTLREEQILRVSEKKMLKEYLNLRGRKPSLLGSNKGGRHVACMAEERGCIGSWWGNRSEGDHWGDLGIDGWIILGRISRRWDVGIWIGLGWPRIETGGGRL